MAMTKTIVFTNNGPYENLGCEAILRGTMQSFGGEKSITFCNVAHFKTSSQQRAHNNKETQSNLRHYSAFKNKHRFLRAFQRRIGAHTSAGHLSPEAGRIFQSGSIALSVGGDNYSLDYGYPVRMVILDDAVFTCDLPYVAWGASIGPFSSDPDYERKIVAHLSRFDLIFAREEETQEYLDDIGMGAKVVLMADPAFAMLARAPEKSRAPNIIRGAIGLNLSPILGRYLGCKSEKEWVELAAKLVTGMYRRIGRKVYLVPHVFKKGNSDYEFMRKVLLRTNTSNDNVELLSHRFNAEESKSIIGKMAAFAGARTHSTIAAMSCEVPTLSLAYSRKAYGINKMVFGGLDYCIAPQAFSVDGFVSAMENLLSDRKQIRTKLTRILPELQASVYSASRKIIKLSK